MATHRCFSSKLVLILLLLDLTTKRNICYYLPILFELIIIYMSDRLLFERDLFV